MDHNHLKKCSTSLSLGKGKLKQQDTITLLTEWSKSGTLTTPNADEDVEQQELSFVVAGK